MKKQKLSIPAIILLMAPVALIYFFSDQPSYGFALEGEAALIVSFKHGTDRVHECDEKELDEYHKRADQLRKHMRRNDSLCGSRERVPMPIMIKIDGADVFNKDMIPSGWRRDGATYIYEKFDLSTGSHTVEIAMNDSREEGYPYQFSATLVFKPRQVIVVGFDQEADRFVAN